MENNILKRIIEKAKREHKAVNIYAHKAPDGDAIASSKALEKVLQDNGIKARYIVKSPRVNNRYSKIVGETKQFQGRVNRNDISVILDTSTTDHVENRLYTFSRPEDTFVIDHHEIETESACIEKDLRLHKENVLRNPEASSTCEILAEQMKDIGLLNKNGATQLLVGLWTDTAKFRYTKSNSINSLNMLLENGADFESVKRCLEAKRPLMPEVGVAKALLHTKRIKVGNTYLNYFGLDNETVKNLEEKYRTQFIQKKIFKILETENTALAVAIAENSPNEFLCEFRSSRNIGNVDVFSVATSMGGGGHYNASGCTVKSAKGLDKVSREVLTKLTDSCLPTLARVEVPQESKNDNIYDAKISFETLMVRSSILAQIPEDQLRNRRINFKLNKNFLDRMKTEYGASEEDVLSQIELFKEVNVDYVSIMTPDGKNISIDSNGNIKKYQRRDTEK